MTVIGWGMCLLAGVLVLPRASFSEECRQDLTQASQIWVHAIQFNIRYFEPPDIPLKTNTLFAPDVLSAAQSAIAHRMSDDDARNAAREFANLGFVSVRVIDSCVRVVEPAVCRRDLQKEQCVDVTFSSHEIRLVRFNQAGLILPLPRSPFSTHFSGVPKPLLILNPIFNVDHDNRMGTTPSVALRTDLLDIGRILSDEDSARHMLEATAAADLSRAIEHNFYKAAEKFDLKKTWPGSTLQSLAIHLEQYNAKEPLGSASDSISREAAGFRANIHLQNAYLHDGFFWAGGSASRHSVPQTNGVLDTSEAAASAAMLWDGEVVQTTARAGLWFSGASPNNQNSYQRLAFFSGLYRDLLVAPNQSFGLQILGGYGLTWGTPAQYAEFFAGNNASNFLYDAPDTLLLTNAPSPIIRSFGKSEAGLAGVPNAGGSSFWNVSTTLTIPVPRLSRPLIPDVIIDDSTNTTLKTVLKKSGTVSAVSFIQAALVRQGVPAKEAQKQAKALVNREIARPVNYIADHANIYSLKPLVLFDVAMLSGPTASRHLESAGGGIEFMIVNFAFQGGYARTLHSQPGDRKGNLVLNLQFRNFF
ncbi:MAG: hypothetical protein JWM08_2143 [Candidatus Angelobacter sp.]|nr:hypothetical protein [Candidatus Angelobacter sp.]